MSLNLSLLRGVAKRRRNLIGILSGAVIVSLSFAITFYFLLMKEKESRFPIFPEGIYAGDFLWLSSEKPFQFVLEREHGEEAVTIDIAGSGIPSSRVLLVSNGKGDAIPVVLSSPLGEISLTGNKEGDGFNGRVLTKGGLVFGSWTLNRIQSTKAQLKFTQDRVDEVTRWMEHRTILDEIRDRQLIVKAQLPLMEKEIDRLNALMGESDKLKEKTKEKLVAALREEDLLNQKAMEKQEIVKRNIKALDAAGRLTPNGRLVMLSRQIIDRESEWVLLKVPQKAK